MEIALFQTFNPSYHIGHHLTSSMVGNAVMPKKMRRCADHYPLDDHMVSFWAGRHEKSSFRTDGYTNRLVNSIEGYIPNCAECNDLRNIRERDQGGVSNRFLISHS